MVSLGRSGHSSRRRHRGGWWLVGVFAGATGLDGTAFNMACAPSTNAACAAREAAPSGDQLHLFSSAIAVVAPILSMTFFVAADFIDHPPAHAPCVGRLVLAALIAASIWMGLAVAVDSADHLGQVGISQRAFLTATACWLIYVGLRTARAPTESTS